MRKKIVTISAMAIISVCLLTGCDSKKDYQDDVDSFSECADEVLELVDDLESGEALEDEDNYNEAISAIKSIQKKIDRIDTSTKKGKELQELASDFCHDYGKNVIFGGNSKKMKKKGGELEDAYIDFIDAAEDKGVDTDELTKYHSKSLRTAKKFD